MRHTCRAVSIAVLGWVSGCHASGAPQQPPKVSPPLAATDAGAPTPSAASAAGAKSDAASAQPTASAAASTTAVTSDNAGQAERTTRPIALTDTTPYGDKVSDFVSLVEGHYSGQWPASSGLGSIDLTVRYDGGPLALSTRTAFSGTPNDRDMDGVEDGSVLIVIPVTIHLVTSDGALVIDAKALPLMAGPARAATLKFIVAFDALTPPFDASKICHLASAPCDSSSWNVMWSAGELSLVEFALSNARSGMGSTGSAAHSLKRLSM